MVGEDLHGTCKWCVLLKVSPFETNLIACSDANSSIQHTVGCHNLLAEIHSLVQEELRMHTEQTVYICIIPFDSRFDR